MPLQAYSVVPLQAYCAVRLQAYHVGRIQALLCPIRSRLLRCMNQGDQVRFRAYRLDGISTSGPLLVRDCPPRDGIAVEKEILH